MHILKLNFLCTLYVKLDSHTVTLINKHIPFCLVNMLHCLLTFQVEVQS